MDALSLRIALIATVALLLTGCAQPAEDRPPGGDAAQGGETDDAAATHQVVHNQIETVGVVEVVEVVLSEDGLVELWERHRLDGEPPSVDWDGEWAVFAAPGRLSGCDEPTVRRVIVDQERVSVHLEAVRAEDTCPDVEEAFSVIIAIDRDHLPADDFTVEMIVDGMRQAETTSSA